MKRDQFLFDYLADRKFKSWLDVGAGTGEVSVAIEQKFGGQYTCIDVAPGHPRVGPFDGRHIKSPTGLFDFVLFNFVLPHAANHTISLLQDALHITKHEVLIQEDLPDGTTVTEAVLRKHDPKALFRKEEEWRVLFRSLGAIVTTYWPFPSYRIAEYPEMLVPRAFMVIRPETRIPMELKTPRA